MGGWMDGRKERARMEKRKQASKERREVGKKEGRKQASNER